MNYIKDFLLFAFTISITINFFQTDLQAQVISAKKTTVSNQFEEFQSKYVYPESEFYSSRLMKINSENILDSVITYDQNYEMCKKEKYYYNEHGNIVSIVTYSFQNPTWDYLMREDYQWNENGNNTEYHSYSWNGSEWVDSLLEIISYDENENIIERYQTIWNGETWDNYYWYIYEFDHNNLPISQQGYYGSGNDWFDYGRFVFTWNFQNKEYQRTYYILNNSQYVERFIYSYVFYDNEFPYRYLTRHQQTRSSATGLWSNTSLTNCEWDNNGNNTLYVYQRWENENWVNNYKYIRQFYSFNRMTNELYQLWDGSNWYDVDNVYRNFDTNGNILDATYTHFQNGSWIRAEGYIQTVEGSWNGSGYASGKGIWHGVVCHKLYGFSSPLTGLNENEPVNNEFILRNNYPNPFNPSTSISYSLPKGSFVNIAIYDLLGKELKSLVTEFQIPGDYKIHWDGTDNYSQQVSTGIYLLRMQSGKYQKSIKMILIK